MTHVDRWFSALTADERKKVLYALHCFRTVGDSMPPVRALQHVRDVRRFIEGLIPALEADHEALKPTDDSRPTIPSPRISGEFSVVPGPPDARSK